MFQAQVEQAQHFPEWLHALAEWIGLALIMWGFKLSAKRDVKQRHDENKKMQEQALIEQKNLLEELKTERDYLPQHWHQKPSDKDGILTYDCIIRKPNGKTNH